MSVPKTPDTKAVGATNSGERKNAKRTAKRGGINAEIVMPFPGTTFEKILETIIIKSIETRAGLRGITVKKYIDIKLGITAPPKFIVTPDATSFLGLKIPKKDLSLS